MECLLGLSENHVEKNNYELFEARILVLTTSCVILVNKDPYLAYFSSHLSFLLVIIIHRLFGLRILNNGALEFLPKEINGKSVVSNFSNSKEPYYGTHQSFSASFVY